MLFQSAVTFLLIGLSLSAVVSLFAAIGTQGQPKRLTLPLHFVSFCVYIPLLAIGVNYLPSMLVGRPSTGWFVLVLVILFAISLHGLLLLLGHVKRVNTNTERIAAVEAISSRAPKDSQLGYVLLNTSVSEYRRTVLSIEENGRDFAYVQRRIAPYFYSDEMLRFVAKERFGAGNQEANKYVSTHQRRRQAFFASLESGARYREMFERRALLRYVQTGTHAEDLWPLPASTVVELLRNWRQALLDHSNYYVGISDLSLPIKYHLIDRECVLLHKPVGKGDDIRLNSVFIFGSEIGKLVEAEFDLVWGLIDPQWRDRKKIARWIADELIPLARSRPKKS